MEERFETNEKLKYFKELSVEELVKGYVKRQKTGEYSCIFCGEIYEEGVVYSIGGRMVTAEKAAGEHMEEVHGGVFNALVSLDKQICGLSDIQKSILLNLYENNDNKAICENMSISAATVRTHKFNLQKAKREAKILLSLLEIVEDEEGLRQKRADDSAGSKADQDESLFAVNSLHPFFTQFKYK